MHITKSPQETCGDFVLFSVQSPFQGLDVQGGEVDPGKAVFGGEEEGRKVVKENFDFFARMMQGSAY